MDECEVCDGIGFLPIVTTENAAFKQTCNECNGTGFARREVHEFFDFDKFEDYCTNLKGSLPASRITEIGDKTYYIGLVEDQYRMLLMYEQMRDGADFDIVFQMYKEKSKISIVINMLKSYCGYEGVVIE
jgi:hypothetical protein